jgi:phage-related minor tail protein
MAGNRIKGITIEFGGDTTKLTDALKQVDSSLKNTQTQLKGTSSAVFR